MPCADDKPTSFKPAPRSGNHVQPPLVTLVVINWNYAAYVGATIDSILMQDYPAFELIVVDNGSTDDSRAVIRRHIAGDSRCRIIQLDSNLGQLGAFFHVFDEIRGSFVAIVDADDTLMSNYVSSHIQVHLAHPRAVAFTSSNVYETDASGRTITGGYYPFASGQDKRTRHLPRIDTVPRLATVTASDYRLLAESTSTIPPNQIGWFWGPGTSNLYRRSVLDLTQRPERDGSSYRRAADAYLNPFCHGLGGSALIHLPLSVYRVHDRNYFAARESVEGMRVGRPEIAVQNELLNCETIEFLLRRAKRYVNILGGDGFWNLIDHVSLDPQSRRLFGLPYLQKALVENFSSLSEIFGEQGLCNALIPRMRSSKLCSVLREVHGGRIPFKLRMTILRKYASRRHTGSQHKENISWRRLTTPHSDEPPELLRNFGPVAVLCDDPPVFKTGIAYEDFLGVAPAFGERYGDIPAGFVIYPTWTIEGRSGALAAAAAEHRDRYKNHRLLFLCNTQREADLISSAGQPAVFLNRNFNVSEKIFRPLPNVPIEFDAIYNARFVPGKRHELAARIDRVAYLSYAEGSVERLSHQRKLMTAILAQNPSHTLVNPPNDGLPVRLTHREVNAALNRAAVGLCLSEVEGANYASMEYMLAGLPVVSTPSEGGRDVYFDTDYCLICEPDAAAVREAVDTLKARSLSREFIRARTLARIEPQRRRFLMLVDEIIAQLGGRRRFDVPWPFAETSGMVTWDTYDNHLSAFERIAGNGRLPRFTRRGG